MWSKNTSRGEKGFGDAGSQGSAGAGTAQLFLGLVFEKRFGTEEWEDERTTKDEGGLQLETERVQTTKGSVTVKKGASEMAHNYNRGSARWHIGQVLGRLPAQQTVHF
jgi:hypothetical protein